MSKNDTKTLEEITKTLEDKAAAVSAEVETLETSVEMDKTSIKAAEAAMTKASDDNDVQAYTTAKRDRQAAEDSLEMHEARLDKLQNVPAMSEQDYREVIDELTAGMDKKVDDIRAEAVNVTAGLIPVRDELRDDVAKVNYAMKVAHDITYPDGKNSSGAIVMTKDYRRHFDLSSWIDRAIGDQGVKK